MPINFSRLDREISELSLIQRTGAVAEVSPGAFVIGGLGTSARVGDFVEIRSGQDTTTAEIISLAANRAIAMPLTSSANMAIGDQVTLAKNYPLKPDLSWKGRVIDAMGLPLDGRPLINGETQVPLRSAPPKASERRPLGARLNTSLAIMDTLLPIARGQRIGIFAGSGVGKTSILTQLARGIQTDVVVIGLIGERGRELNEFVEKGLGPEGLKRSVVVAATSDQSPIMRRRAAWTATAVAEYFRDAGLQVLLILDSITRFAEAHREVALTAGEVPSMRAYPPSTSNMIAALAERSGTGAANQGDITSIYSVLVAGSDMEEPVADMTRGILDGHIVLDREIAERGRFPAINVLQSVSRSLPGVASHEENEHISEARKILNLYAKSEPLIQSGLYQQGTDQQIDRAIRLWPQLDNFTAISDLANSQESYSLLQMILTQEDQEAMT